MVGQFGDLRYSLAQVDLDADLIALGDQLFAQHVGVGHWQRPGLPVPRLECDRPLGLINAHDRARAKRRYGFTGVDRHTHQAQ